MSRHQNQNQSLPSQFNYDKTTNETIRNFEIVTKGVVDEKVYAAVDAEGQVADSHHHSVQNNIITIKNIRQSPHINIRVFFWDVFV